LNYPILYSFRRCPYAMRARLALAYAGIAFEHREILLKNRPSELITISPKGTVPVLQLQDGTVIDESIEIMKWALLQNDPDNWYIENIKDQDSFITQNDGEFKKKLDQYKYHERFPNGTYKEYQASLGKMLKRYEIILSDSLYLISNKISLVDIALFPFIRQGAHIDLIWFNVQFPKLTKWMNKFISMGLFISIMVKYDVWISDETGILIQGS